jgi:hypothetical protein
MEPTPDAGVDVGVLLGLSMATNPTSWITRASRLAARWLYGR